MQWFHSDYYEQINEHLMTIKETINVSFELFPPKTLISKNKFWNSIDELKLFNPKFFSVTCGANFSKKFNTCNLAKKIINRTGINTVPHFTCVDSTTEELKNLAQEYWKNGINHVLALRGDVPNSNNKPIMYAVDLIKLLKDIADFEISVAAYPEIHPEAYSSHHDLLNLKKKIDAGATRAITQFFFSIEHFLKFRDRCVKNNINVNIVPGIFPITNFDQLCRFSIASNVKIPNWLRCMFDGLDNNINVSKIIGANIAIDIVKSLFSEGIRDFHFYTLNQFEVTSAVCHVLGIKPYKRV